MSNNIFNTGFKGICGQLGSTGPNMSTFEVLQLIKQDIVFPGITVDPVAEGLPEFVEFQSFGTPSTTLPQVLNIDFYNSTSFDPMFNNIGPLSLDILKPTDLIVFKVMAAGGQDTNIVTGDNFLNILISKNLGPLIISNFKALNLEGSGGSGSRNGHNFHAELHCVFTVNELINNITRVRFSYRKQTSVNTSSRLYTTCTILRLT